MTKQLQAKLTQAQYNVIEFVCTYARLSGLDPTRINLRYQDGRTFGGLVKRGLAVLDYDLETGKEIYRLIDKAEHVYWQQKRANQKG